MCQRQGGSGEVVGWWNLLKCFKRTDSVHRGYRIEEGMSDSLVNMYLVNLSFADFTDIVEPLGKHPKKMNVVVGWRGGDVQQKCGG